MCAKTTTKLLFLTLLLAAATAPAANPPELLDTWRSQAGAAADPARGRELFTADHGNEWRCTTCHGNPPVGTGKHAVTGKPIQALAPAVNADRFTDAARAEKWFRRNCRDVLGRECTALEKADVLAWLLTLPAQ
jgi:cytochrome c553